MQKDITIKDTIKTITEDIARHILELEVSDIRFVDKELQRIEKREADIVVQCKINGTESILHIEIQNNNDRTMPKRMLRYYTDIAMRFDTLPIHQYLIYIGKPKLTMKDGIIEKHINYHYTIVDMHTIDCDKFIEMDTPDALVLSVLCDFKGRDELDMLLFITRRLEELTRNDEYRLGKYMLILETLSTNRDLTKKLKEVEDMLREIKYEDLPSYEIGIERGMQKGMQRGIERGVSQGAMQAASTMIKKFKLSVEDVAKELNISIVELKKYLGKE